MIHFARFGVLEYKVGDEIHTSEKGVFAAH
jgi:hypothetical protein